MEQTELRVLSEELRKWEIPEALYRAVPAALANILLNGTNKEKIAAAKVIADIHQQNKDDKPKPTLVAHKHIHVVIQHPTEANIDQKRQELLARIARLG